MRYDVLINSGSGCERHSVMSRRSVSAAVTGQSMSRTLRSKKATRKARLDGRREMLSEADGARYGHDDHRIANAFAINL